MLGAGVLTRGAVVRLGATEVEECLTVVVVVLAAEAVEWPLSHPPSASIVVIATATRPAVDRWGVGKACPIV